MTRNCRLRQPIVSLVGSFVLITAAGLVAACASEGPDSSGPVRRPAASTVGRDADQAAPADRASTFVTSTPRLGVAGCALFPRDHAFAAAVGSLPVAVGSERTIAAIGPSTTLMAGFGAAVWEGSRLGYPVNVVDGRHAPRHELLVSSDNAGTSTTEGVPWPTGPRFEGWPGRAWDKHLLVVDRATCSSYEAINMQPPGENPWATRYDRWYADKVVHLDLGSNAIPSDGTVTASGISMLAGLVRYDEVRSGRIDHVLSMSSPVVRRGPGVWPASGTDGRSDDPDAPPMGTWLRLKAGTDLSGLGPQAKVVARAMQDHGVVIVDSGPHAALTGEPDLRWDDADLAGLRNLTVSQLEVVDASPMKVSDDSYRIR